ncbi:hypothetical protein CKO15_02335 [Halorhodospira abdelmalekii]|uniref:UPF0149 family protein n=1 Tax=Halorhodospira abdelmalekii TaxID=421629 RepID=UPI001903753C|nr:UPF0149 family protein [Halorhodospira abdelmalekii]MBK1734137.1 hypothetical protein [Halorhodospira abdelmalekii]
MLVEPAHAAISQETIQPALQQLRAHLSHATLSLEEAAARLGERLEGAITLPTHGSDGRALALTRALDQHLAELPLEQRARLYGQLMRRREPLWQQVTLYSLLAPEHTIRREALLALRTQISDGALSDRSSALLPWVRAWLPTEEESAELQALLADAPLQRAQNTQNTSTPVEQIFASIPDGTGQQYLIITAQRGRDGDEERKFSNDNRLAGMLILQTCHGLLETHFAYGLTAEEQALIVERARVDGPLAALSPEHAAALLSNAIAESLEEGRPPPPGLLDFVAEFEHLCGLVPRLCAARDWLAVLDPEGHLGQLTPQRRGRLIHRSAEWPERFPIVESWFEDTPTIRAILAANGTEYDHSQQQRRLRRYLDVERRPWWAEQCFKTAVTLHQSHAAETWMSFAAVGKALLDGRELRKIPLLEHVLATTLAAHEQGNAARRETERTADADSLPEEMDGAYADDDGQRTTLEAYFGTATASIGNAAAATTPSQGWNYYSLHGYLFAIATHPEPIPPRDWMAPLTHTSPHHAARLISAPAHPTNLQSITESITESSGLKPVIRALMTLHHQIVHQVLAGCPELPTGCTLDPDPLANFWPNAPIGHWSRGFAEARTRFGHLLEWLPQHSEDEWDVELAQTTAFATMVLEAFGDREQAQAWVDGARRSAADTTNAQTLEQFASGVRDGFHESFQELALLAYSMRELDRSSDDVHTPQSHRS